MVGFKFPVIQGTTNATHATNTESNEDFNPDDGNSALEALDQLLAHVSIDVHSLSATEFSDVDADTPAFNE